MMVRPISEHAVCRLVLAVLLQPERPQQDWENPVKSARVILRQHCKTSSADQMLAKQNWSTTTTTMNKLKRKKAGKISLLNLSCPLDNSVGWGTDHDLTDLVCAHFKTWSANARLGEGITNKCCNDVSVEHYTVKWILSTFYISVEWTAPECSKGTISWHVLVKDSQTSDSNPLFPRSSHLCLVFQSFSTVLLSYLQFKYICPDTKFFDVTVTAEKLILVIRW